MNWEIMFPGKYLKSAEFNGKQPTLTISKIHLEDLPEEKGGTKKRGIVSFKETPKQWVLNRTNATAIKQMFGPETDRWIGKRVCLWAAPFTDPFTGEQGTAIRVVGSPDIQVGMDFTAKIGRKQAQFKLKKTAAAGAKGTAPATAVPPPDEPQEPLSPRDVPEGADDADAPWNQGESETP